MWTRRPVGRLATSASRRSRLAASSTRASSASTSRRAEGSACGSAVTTRIVVDQSAHSYAGPYSCGCAPMAASVGFGRSVSADRLPHRAAYRYAMAVRALRPPPEPNRHLRTAAAATSPQLRASGGRSGPNRHQIGAMASAWRDGRRGIPGRVPDSVVITTVSVTRHGYSTGSRLAASAMPHPQQLTSEAVVAAREPIHPQRPTTDVSCCGAAPGNYSDMSGPLRPKR